MPDNEMLAQEEPIIKTVVRNDTLMQVATTTTIGLTGGRMKPEAFSPLSPSLRSGVVKSTNP